MALINCKECGMLISDKATVCPKCGAPVTVSSTAAADSATNNPEPVRFCRECGAKIITDTPFCPNCGASLKAGTPPPTAQTTQTAQPTQTVQAHPQYATCPETHLAKAIVFTLICCWPFGIPAIVNAASVEKEFNAGNYALAAEKSKEANKWCNVCLIGGISLWVLYLIIVFIGMIFGFSMEFLDWFL